MSIDNQKNSGSPGLKRRLSKERLTPKLDMQKEREDLLHSLESLGEDPQESSNGGIPAESQNTYPPPPVQHQDSLQDSPKSAKRMSTKMLAKVSMFEQASTSPPVPRSTSTPVNSPQVNGPIEPSSECIAVIGTTTEYSIVSTVALCRLCQFCWPGGGAIQLLEASVGVVLCN